MVMGKKLRGFIEKYRDILSYLFFGGLTTVVSFLTYALFYYIAGFSATVSNGLSWVLAVGFAYLTNKPFVFKSHDWSMKTVLPELGAFVGCRIGSGLLETAFLALTVDWLGWNSLWMKVVASIMVVILNYIGSKLLVFRKQS